MHQIIKATDSLNLSKEFEGRFLISDSRGKRLVKGVVKPVFGNTGGRDIFNVYVRLEGHLLILGLKESLSQRMPYTEFNDEFQANATIDIPSGTRVRISSAPEERILR